jgi:Rrf2 family transcriptional regulator, nitric oxide-sensitive transcriptional repressor
MFTKSTISAVRALIHLSKMNTHVAVPPRRIAAVLGESPSYLAKVMRHLVKSGILRAEKGATGGLRLSQPPSRITLLDILESCQGKIQGDYCNAACPNTPFCHFHEATLELQRAICGLLSRWTLADLLERPSVPNPISGEVVCFMAKGSHIATQSEDLVSAPKKGSRGGRRG